MPRIAEAESAVIGLDAVAQLEMLERMWLIRAFEEKVVELQQSKRDLAEAIIKADGSLIRDIKREDLELLLA